MAETVETREHLLTLARDRALRGNTYKDLAVAGISVQGRAAQGVTIFKVDEGEKVVSVERIADVGGGE